MHGFIDIQVNGYAGIDFLNRLLTAEELHTVATRLREDGLEAVLLTITTDDLAMMRLRLDNFRKLIDADAELRRLMPAFHIEGPCISPLEGYRGAHRAEQIRPATPEIFKPLAEAAGGWNRLAMVTLAPEVDAGFQTTGYLLDQGVIVAVGHTDASLPQLREVEAMGVRLFTHFGNGCRHLVDRHDNILNRALSLEQMHYSFIADGHHLPWHLLGAWLKFIGLERSLFTTDCVAPASAPPGRYTVGHHVVQVGPNKRVQPTDSPILAGSALTMRDAYQNAIEHLGLTPQQARQLTIDNPRKLIARFLRD